jgi:hypothetical protein
MTTRRIFESAEMIKRDIEGIFIAVPSDAVTLNGIYRPKLNTKSEPYNGYWHLVYTKNNRAVDDEYGRPYLYFSYEDAFEDATGLIETGEFSTCGGVVTLSAESIPRVD